MTPHSQITGTGPPDPTSAPESVPTEPTGTVEAGPSPEAAVGERPQTEASPASENGERAPRLARTGRPYMSIGEVLTLLKPEFTDVTISKIRFLESEGLIDPERTPSGYRKFYQGDLDRLRFILKLQRDSYLPLKVIRDRLAEYDAGLRPSEEAEPAEPAPATRPEVEPEEDLEEASTALQLSDGELAGMTGLELRQIQSLKEFGILSVHGPAGAPYFDQDDVIVGRIVKDFMALGVEPRHLKMWRHFAEREAALFEQVVLPLMRHRSPETRKQASQTLTDLARLAKKLRHALLRESLRAYLAGKGT